MEKNHHRKYLYRITAFFILFLFAACLTVNAFFCSSNPFYESLEDISIVEACTISENIAADEDGNVAFSISSSINRLNQNTIPAETIAKNLYLLHAIAALPNECSLPIFRIIVFLFSFSALFLLLSKKWTLVSQKIRLDI